MKYSPNTSMLVFIPTINYNRLGVIGAPLQVGNKDYSIINSRVDYTSPYTQKNTNNSLLALRNNLLKIEEYRKLEKNWNLNDAEPFEEQVLALAETILKGLVIQPKVFPTGRQTVQFEYEKENGDYLEFEISANNTTCLEIVNEEESEQTISSDFDVFNKIIQKFYA